MHENVDYVSHEETVVDEDCVVDIVSGNTREVVTVVDHDGDEEEFYEEMEEEVGCEVGSEEVHPFEHPSFAHPFASKDVPGCSTRDPQPQVIHSAYQAIPTRCYVCGERRTARIRLFKWPKDRRVRIKWCAFFGIDELAINLNYDSCFICCLHFQASSFLYSDSRIFWSRDAFPRFRQRRPACTEPFPWELEISSAAQSRHARPTSLKPPPPPPGIQVHFRASNYKVRGRQKHPVAVIPIPGNPHIFYEFHMNRTSFDGTKFYSCLGCRKAKTETHIKDVIRTIHLSGTEILSRGDPLCGHHIACRPINAYAPPTTELRRDASHHMDAYYGLYEEGSGMKKEMLYLDDDEVLVGLDPTRRTQLSKYYEEELYYPTPLVAQSLSSVEPPPHLTQEEHLNEDVMGSAAKIEATQASGIPAARKIIKVLPNSSENVKRYYSDDTTLSCVNNKYTRRCAPSPRLAEPRCHLCTRRFPSTSSLVAHLTKHVQRMPDCTLCGSRCSPDDPLPLRRMKVCVGCRRTDQ